MKATSLSICLALCTLPVLFFTGCSYNKPSPSPVKTFEMPAEASPPDAMTVNELLYIVNELLGYEDESKKRFKKEDAEVFNLPASPERTEVLYLFMVGDLEIGLFADSERDGVISAYVRMLFDYAMVEAYMMSFAGAFLAALEPNEYEKMLLSVVPADDDDPAESKTAYGEFWRVRYAKSLMNILPR